MKTNKTTGNYIIVFRQGKTIRCVPTKKSFANARIVNILDDGSFTAHWIDNYNTSGHFSTELMLFDNDFCIKTKDEERRNKHRINNNLISL